MSDLDMALCLYAAGLALLTCVAIVWCWLDEEDRAAVWVAWQRHVQEEREGRGWWMEHEDQGEET